MAITIPAPPIKDKVVTDQGYMSASLQGWMTALYKALGSSTTTGTAPAGATYITQSSNTDLTAEQSLGALATGVILNTTSGGVGTLSIATPGTDYYKPGDTDVAVVDGGTGSSTASGARTNLGLVIGTDVQAYDSQLNDVAGLTATDNGVIIGNGSNFVVESGSTLKTSLGLTIGTDIQAFDAQLADIAGLTPTDNGVVIGNGANFVVESGATLKTSLGLTIGTDVQAYDVELAALAGLTSAADKLPYFTGLGTADVTTFTSAGRALVDDASATAQRTTLGLADGTYSAAFTNAANLDSTPSNTTCQYLQIGNTVTVSGKVTIDPTLPATSTRIGISLPVASDFANDGQCGGTAAAPGIAGQVAAIIADVTNNRAEMKYISGDTTSQDMWFTFTYVVV